jgi:hypothetical protein
MSFATKLGQFTEGVAQGIAPGLNLGIQVGNANRVANDTANRQNVQANQTQREQIEKRWQNGDREGAIAAATAFDPQYAEELRARGPAQQMQAGRAAAAQAGTVLGQAAAAGESGNMLDPTARPQMREDLTAGLAAATGAQGAIETAAGLPSEVPAVSPTGEQGFTQEAPTGVTDPAMAEALFRAEMVKAQKESQLAKLNTLDRATLDLEQANFLGRKYREDAVSSYQKELEAVGASPAIARQYTAQALNSLQQARDNNFMLQVPKFDTAESMIDAAIDADLSPTSMILVQSLAKGMSEKEGIAEAQRTMGQLSILAGAIGGIKNTDAREAAFASLSTMATSAYGEETGGLFLDAVKRKAEYDDFMDLSRLNLTIAQLRADADKSQRLGDGMDMTLHFLMQTMGLKPDPTKQVSAEMIQEYKRLYFQEARGRDAQTAQTSDLQVQVGAIAERIATATEQEKRKWAANLKAAFPQSYLDKISAELAKYGFALAPDGSTFVPLNQEPTPEVPVPEAQLSKSGPSVPFLPEPVTAGAI